MPVSLKRRSAKETQVSAVGFNLLVFFKLTRCPSQDRPVKPGGTGGCRHCSPLQIPCWHVARKVSPHCLSLFCLVTQYPERVTLDRRELYAAQFWRSWSKFMSGEIGVGGRGERERTWQARSKRPSKWATSRSKFVVTGAAPSGRTVLIPSEQCSVTSSQPLGPHLLKLLASQCHPREQAPPWGTCISGGHT